MKNREIKIAATDDIHLEIDRFRARVILDKNERMTKPEATLELLKLGIHSQNQNK